MKKNAAQKSVGVSSRTRLTRKRVNQPQEEVDLKIFHNYGKIVRFLRRQMNGGMGETQSDLALRSGFAVSNLCDLENQVQPPTLANYEKILWGLGCRTIADVARVQMVIASLEGENIAIPESDQLRALESILNVHAFTSRNRVSPASKGPASGRRSRMQ
jgi:hypothetical protein